jgi:hypothetical protein
MSWRYPLKTISSASKTSKPGTKKVRTLTSRTEQNHQQGIDPANKRFNASQAIVLQHLSFSTEAQRSGEIRFLTNVSNSLHTVLAVARFSWSGENRVNPSCITPLVT